jgi:hypothetical protein
MPQGVPVRVRLGAPLLKRAFILFTLPCHPGADGSPPALTAALRESWTRLSVLEKIIWIMLKS